jgi:hypothetical protein
MMWQDIVFLVGSMTSVMFLYPTLRDTASRVPRATSVPSMIIGGVYSVTFFTLGMEFSAIGSFSACTMWSLIAAFRAPDDGSITDGTPVPRPAEWRRLLAARTQRLRGTTGSSRVSGDAAPNSD